jgi:hypothetical protein
MSKSHRKPTAAHHILGAGHLISRGGGLGVFEINFSVSNFDEINFSGLLLVKN